MRLCNLAASETPQSLAHFFEDKTVAGVIAVRRPEGNPRLAFVDFDSAANANACIQICTGAALSGRKINAELSAPASKAAAKAAPEPEPAAPKTSAPMTGQVKAAGMLPLMFIKQRLCLLFPVEQTESTTGDFVPCLHILGGKRDNDEESDIDIATREFSEETAGLVSTGDAARMVKSAQTSFAAFPKYISKGKYMLFAFMSDHALRSLPNAINRRNENLSRLRLTRSSGFLSRTLLATHSVVQVKSHWEVGK